MCEILTSWELSEKEGDLIIEAVRLGLEDASVKARESARFAYLQLHQLYPKKTEKLKASLAQGMRDKLTRAEQQHAQLLLQKNSAGGPMPSSGAGTGAGVGSAIGTGSGRGKPNKPDTVAASATRSSRSNHMNSSVNAPAMSLVNSCTEEAVPGAGIAASDGTNGVTAHESSLSRARR